MILLSVVILIAAGCGNKKTDVAMNTEPTETVTEDSTETEKVAEPEVKTESEEEETEATETDKKEDKEAQTVNETSDSNASKQTESKTQTTSNDNSNTQNQDSSSQQEQQPIEPVTTEPTPQPEPQVISYSPQNVVSLATTKTKAAGKVLLTENLDNLLASGQISQEEYNEYYHYDGAGYYSVFVDTNMAEARDVSGTESLNSEDKIAQSISDMLVLENGPYFLIEYAGTYDYYGKQCYEFRCYRA